MWSRLCLSAGVIACLTALTACGAATPTPPARPVTPRPALRLGSGSVVLNDDFGGRALFPPTNWWNQDISAAPVDPNSIAYIAFIGATRGLHPISGPRRTAFPT